MMTCSYCGKPTFNPNVSCCGEVHFVEENSTCDYCGDEVPSDTFVHHEGDKYCPACEAKRLAKEAEESDWICPNCSGSGEGMYEGTTCYVCHGRGTV